MRRTQPYSQSRKIMGLVVLSGCFLFWFFLGPKNFESEEQVDSKRALESSQWQQLRSQLDTLKNAKYSERKEFTTLANEIIVKVDFWTQNQKITDVSRPGQPLVKQNLERISDNIKNYLNDLEDMEPPQWQNQQLKIWNALSQLLDVYFKNFLKEK